MQALLDVLLQAIPTRRVVAHLDLDRHLVADDAIAYVALGDAQPFAGGAIVALDRRQAGLRPDAHAADAHHGVAATEHFLHAAEAAAAFAAVAGDDAGEVAQGEADHRLVAAMQDGAHHVADLPVRNRPVVFDADDFEEGR